MDPCNISLIACQHPLVSVGY